MKLTDKEFADVLKKVQHIVSMPPADLGLNVAALETNMAELDADFRDELGFDFGSSPSPSRTTGAVSVPVVSAPGSRKTTIRIPNRILDAFKSKAKASGIPYQTLMIRALSAASA